jgi:DNA-binding MarR family transcriptional regulator
MLTNEPLVFRSARATRRPETAAGEAAQLADLLARTSRRLYRSSMAELGPMGLTGGQARVIGYLEHAGAPARMADIAAALEVVPRTATSMVDGLEAAGLVARATDPHDRRSVLVSLTDDGSRLLRRLASARRKAAEAAFKPLPPSDRRELGRLLTAICPPCRQHDCTGSRAAGRER